MTKNYFLRQRALPWCRLALATLLAGSSFAAHAHRGPGMAASPLAANDAAVSVIYTYGKLATPAALPHAVQAVVTNAGTATLTNLPVTLTVTGANAFTNTQTVTSIPVGGSATVTFAAYPGTLNLGSNLLTVTVPADDNASNNAATFTQRVSAARLSYIDTAQAFNPNGATVGQAGGALAVKYTLNSAVNYLGSARATFAATSSATTTFQVQIYDAQGTGNTPGNLLYTSATQSHTAAAGVVTVPLPSVQVGATFFVALKELDNGLGLATQPELPARPNTFYYQPAGGSWAVTASQTRRALEVALTTAPACPAPTYLAATSNSPTGATVTFTAPSNGTAYTIIYGAPNFNPSTGGTTVQATTSPVTLSGLTANTTYQVYVRATCGSSGTSTLVGPISFTTACKVYTFPYSENFDAVTATALPCGITVLDANGDATTWKTSANGNSTPNSMRYSYSSSNAANDWFFTPGLPLRAGYSYQLQFKYRGNSTFYTEGLEVKAGTSTNPTNLSTTLFSNSNILGTTYVTTAAGYLAGQIPLFTPAAAGTYYFGFHAISAADQLYLDVDDIIITEVATPACLPPTALSVSNLTTTGATVTFTGPSNGSTYTIIYGPSGFNPATGGTTVTATTSPVTLSGLTASTTYQVYIQATCGSNGSSTLTGPVSFATACPATYVIPYLENFDGPTAPALPCGVTVLDANGDNTTWTNASGVGNTTPNAMRYAYNSSNAADDWFFTAPLQLVAGKSYQLQFKYKVLQAIYPEGLEVKVGSATTAASQTTTLFSNTNLTNTTYATTVAGTAAGQVGLFTANASGTYYFSFHAISIPNQESLYVDDVQITEVPTPACPAPSGLAVNAVTTTGATVAFVGPSNGTAYSVIYGLSGFNPATGGTIVNGVASPVTLTGLLANTNYCVYVRATCGTSGTSTLVGPVCFTTACASATAPPYSENFDGVTAPALPCGVTVLDANNDGVRWVNYNGTGTGGSSPNAMRYTYSSSSAANDWFFTAPLTLTAGVSYQLQFKYKSGTSYTEALEVKVGSTATAAGQTTTVFSNTNITNNGGAYTTTTAGSAAGQVASFVPNTSGTYYFGFHAISIADQLYLYVDDVQVTATSAAGCPTPTNVAVSNVTSSGATVTFTPPTAGTSYKIIYGASGFNPATGGTTVTASASPVTLSGLAPGSTYQVYVQATCGSNGNSVTAGPISFATPCVTNPNPPYSESFDGVAAPALPCGVTVLDANNDGNTWATSNTAFSSSPNSMRYSPSTIVAADDWFFGPGLSLQAGTAYQLQFKYRSTSGVYPERLEVKVGTATTAAGQTTTLFSNTSITNQTFQTAGSGVVATFRPTSSGTYYFGFHAFSTANSFFLHVDDVSVSTVLSTRSSVAPGFQAEASPVPFGERLTVTLNTLQAGPLRLTLHDAVGRVVRETTAAVPVGASSVGVPEAGSLPAGIYLLTVSQGSSTQVIRVAHE